MKRILRVFPYRTSYTPEDDMVFIGMPPLIIPEHDEVHVSCTFTWDKKICEELAFQWEGRTNKPVKLGGVAYNSPVEGVTGGLHRDRLRSSQGAHHHSRGSDPPAGCTMRFRASILGVPPPGQKWREKDERTEEDKEVRSMRETISGVRQKEVLQPAVQKCRKREKEVSEVDAGKGAIRQ